MTVSEDVPPPAVISDQHPGHKLNRVEHDGRLFVCDGCMEPGLGSRYRCEHERCNFDLHTCCAVASDTLTHPAFGDDRVFLFLLQPPATTTAGEIKGGGRTCVACGKVVRGFVYHSFTDEEDGGLDLHPCCARLPEYALLKQAPRQRIMSDDDEKRSIRIHRPAAARHRRWVGAGTKPSGGRDDHPPPSPEKPQRLSDTSEDRNHGGREHRPPVARHRWWKH